jgi:hypothetical protein
VGYWAEYIPATYDPSGRRDSGITRSSVRGSTAMPAAVLGGLIGGLDIMTREGRKCVFYFTLRLQKVRLMLGMANTVHSQSGAIPSQNRLRPNHGADERYFKHEMDMVIPENTPLSVPRPRRTASCNRYGLSQFPVNRMMSGLMEERKQADCLRSEYITKS